MLNPISDSRWKDAQEFEFNDWKNEPDIVEHEWQELKGKFSMLFPQIARQVNLEQDDAVLDVGCGPTVPSRLLGAGCITGLDPLAASLGIDKAGFIPGVIIVSEQAEQMSFPDESFRLVVCRNVIDHTQNPKQIIGEIDRVLEKNGYLLLICYTYAPFITWVKNASEHLGIFNNKGHPFTFTPSSLEKLVEGTFAILDRYTIHIGQHSTDYGKAGHIHEDYSIINRFLIWVNKMVFRSNWFVKEYGYLARKMR